MARPSGNIIMLTTASASG